MLTFEELNKILKSWKRNEFSNKFTKADVALMFAWNYDRVDKNLFFETLSNYNLETECTEIKEFINQTLY